ncbi:aromatic acid exporter family protein [Carnobacterium sp. ISL-102]|uniref:FUSC family protein n=1 Tax=Carnobacterium sp. ISL-102 TaxID=2819142 RepID=UPI001BE532C9|nr:aromatic acid exporter family protein [Carnobacterium sp. ISL-102]MBT2732936.1 FUSC family protein [Carnobacterium sp. ISL-102]
MTIGNYRIGMRTLKTGLAVGLCLLLFHFLDREPPMIAALSAVFGLREDWQKSLKFGKTRIFGNSIGAIFAALLVLLQQFSGQFFLVEMIGVPIGVILIIIFCDLTNYNNGIIGASAAFLIIYFSIPTDETVLYAFARIVDTFIGTFIAISVNRLIPGGPKPSDKFQT